MCLGCYPGFTEHPTIAAIATAAIAAIAFKRFSAKDAQAESASLTKHPGCSVELMLITRSDVRRPTVERAPFCRSRDKFAAQRVSAKHQHHEPQKTMVRVISSFFLLLLFVYGWYWHVWNAFIPQEAWGRKDSRISLICRVSIVPILIPAQQRDVKNALNFQPIVGPESLAPCSTEDSSIQCERNKGHTHTQTTKITTSFKRGFAGSINGRSQLIEILQKHMSSAISRSVQQ